MTFDEVVELLEKQARETFAAGVFHQDMGIAYSATDKEAGEFEAAAECLKDLRSSLFGDAWAITKSE